MRDFQIKSGTLWFIELVPYYQKSKVHYKPAHRGYISRRPEWYLKIRALVWKWLGK